MSKVNNQITSKVGQIVYCINSSVYDIHITKAKAYIINEIGEGTKEGKIRIKGNMKLVWIPIYHFANEKPTMVNEVIITDEITDPNKDYVEVDVYYDNNTKYWLNVMTPKHLEKLLESPSHLSYNCQNTIFVKTLSKSNIERAIKELDNSSELIKYLIPYENH